LAKSTTGKRSVQTAGHRLFFLAVALTAFLLVKIPRGIIGSPSIMPLRKVYP